MKNPKSDFPQAKKLMSERAVISILMAHANPDLKGWRKQGNINLRGANLTRIDLSYKVLNGLNMRGCDLSGANLTGASLNDVDLHRANLTGANLFGAHLHRANLTKANLTGANLTKAYLSQTNFDRAILTGAIMTDADFLWRANISESDLVWAYLMGARRPE